MSEIEVAESADIGEAERRIVAYGAHEIGIIRVQGQLHAFLNVCPHQGGPVCQGLLIHKVEEVIDENKNFVGMKFDENSVNLVCPWHGWEFDVTTGRCAGDAQQGLRKFKTRESNGKIYVDVG